MKTLCILSLIALAVIAWKFGWFNEDTEIAAVNTHEAIVESKSLVNSAVTKLREQKSAFAGIIGDFEKESTELETVLEGGKDSLLGFKSAIQEARDKDAEFNKVYGKWDSVEKKTITLRARFNQLVEGADDFYGVVRERAGSIKDETLRSESLAFVQKSELAYAEQLKKTKTAIAQVDGMKIKVDDTMKALEIRFAVDVIDQRLGEMFTEIDGMIESVLTALKELEAESKQVLGSVA